MHHQSQSRLQHLGELYGMNSLDDVKYEQWSRTRLDRLLVDYLLRSGYKESATALAKEKNIGDLVDVDTFVQMGRIRESLLNGRITEALAWCNENKKELRRMDVSTLKAWPSLCVSDGHPEQSRVYAPISTIHRISTESRSTEIFRSVKPRKKVPYTFQGCLSKGGPAGMRPISVYTRDKGLGLWSKLNMKPPPLYRISLNPHCQELYDQSRWTTLANLFMQTHNTLLGLPSVPLLHIALSSGLSALKTPSCHSSHISSISPTSSSSLTTSVCPICSTELNDLARNVPYAHHTKSHVESDLYLLPNGCVYGRDRLEEYSRKAGLGTDMIKDLRTGEIFPSSEVQKVFIS